MDNRLRSFYLVDYLPPKMTKHRIKGYQSPGYNWLFDTNDGFFVRWGKNHADNPDFSPVGPELLDIEISEICSRGCPHCYKSNTKEGVNMSFKTFKKMFKKFPKNLTQIAFGIGDIDGNPDLWKIMDYCRKNGVIPNITINGEKLTDAYATKLAMVCGAVAVSHYNDDTCFNAVEKLTNAGLEQVNIHQLLARETIKSTINAFYASKTDERLKGLNAIVLLGVKQKGRGIDYHSLSYGAFKQTVDIAFQHNIPIGFDSCSAHKFLKAIEGKKKYEYMTKLAEPCESSCFSYYINANGIAYPCSFLEGEEGYEGINVLKAKDFLKDVWYAKPVENFRKALIQSGRQCLRYDI